MIAVVGAAALVAETAKAQVVHRADGGGFRVGYFGVTPTDYLFQSFRGGLRDLGYIEGENLELIYVRQVQGSTTAITTAAADLIRRNPEVIVAGTTPPTQVLKSLTQTIPIVMVSVSDPLGAGLVESASRPGRNITGLANNLSGAPQSSAFRSSYPCSL